MPSPWLSKAAAQLRDQVDARWPRRDTAADGWIGDASHANRVSDHNPDPLTGVVRALDIDADGIPAQALADTLAAARDVRIAYIVFDNRIASLRSDPPWSWRPYTGTDPHRSHIHVSFTAAGDYTPAPFPLPEEPPVPINGADAKVLWTSPVGNIPGQPGWWQALMARLDAIEAKIDGQQ